MGNAVKAKPEDIRQQYETQLKVLREAYGEAILELRASKKIGRPVGEEGRSMILHIQKGLPAVPEGRRTYRSNDQTLSLVRGYSPYRVLRVR
jgi:hypothetical protein